MKRIVFTLTLSFLILMNFANADAIARVMKSDGDVMLKPIGNQSFSADVKAGRGINNGDAIRIGETGFAIIIFIDDKSVVKIRENTEFQFIDSPSTRTLELQQGTIFNKVTKQTGGKSFRVETPVSVASVKGTEFAAVSDPSGMDQFFCQEGNFDVYNSVSGQTINVQPGQQAISNALGTLTQQPFSPKDYPTEPEADIQDIQEEEPEAEEEAESAEEEQIEPEESKTEEPQRQAEEPQQVPEQQPEVPESEAPPATPEAGSPFGMGLGVGSVTIDGILYNQIALRPEFRFGKLGVGLDLVIYIDNEGNVRPNEWDVKNDPSVILDKVLYVRWGEKQDPFWIKLGSLDNVTLGYGGLLMGYSNMMEFPTVRQIGVNTGMNFGNIGTEIFMSNVKDFSRGGTLLGLRGTYKVSKAFPLMIGANLVMDLNQFSGMKDGDDDTYPDIFDDFPDDKKLWNDTDGDGIPDPHSGVDSTTWDIDADGDNVYDPIDNDLSSLKGTPFSIEDNRASITAFAFDIGYPILSNKMISLLLYSEFNFINIPEAGKKGTEFYRDAKTGNGFSIPGVRMNLFKFLNVNVEYRLKSGYYVPQFFDQSYDITRVVPIYTNDETKIYTKDMVLFADSTMKEDLSGYFGSISADVFGFASLSGAYANMTSASDTIKSFFASVNVNPDNIPKLSVATAYYQRNNDRNPFDFGNPSVNTVLGYRLGYEISKGVSLIWDFRQFYRDNGTGELEPIKQTTIETSFDF
ncbi:MAG: FecR domain-containing protein [Fidelibacterota bacterium]